MFALDYMNSFKYLQHKSVLTVAKGLNKSCYRPLYLLL